MKKFVKVDNLSKGDVVTVVEQTTLWGEFVHKFVVVRDNPKTYSCRYIEGAHKGMEFGWIKGYDLTQLKNREFYI